MPSNSFGELFRVTVWGESHGPAIGCVIDGCPAGLPLTEADIQAPLDLRRPAQNPFVSQRKESDTVEILSGLFEGHTTGAPISLLIKNEDAQPKSYEKWSCLFRPGRADFTAKHKYGLFDWRGGGRFSGRLSCCLVAAGAIAEKILALQGIEIRAFTRSCGPFISEKKIEVDQPLSPLFCLDDEDSQKVKKILLQVQKEGDSIGGSVECVAFNLPIGLGEPLFERLDAKLASSMMSIGGCKAFEIGEGIMAAKMKGSDHNDGFSNQDAKVKPTSNHSGGLLGGMSTGEPLLMRAHFKPTPTLGKSQKTCDYEGKQIQCEPADSARHDSCIAIRAVPVCKSMCACVLADALLQNRLSKISFSTKEKPDMANISFKQGDLS